MIESAELSQARSCLEMAVEVYGPVWAEVAFEKTVVFGFNPPDATSFC